MLTRSSRASRFHIGLDNELNLTTFTNNVYFLRKGLSPELYTIKNYTYSISCEEVYASDGRVYLHDQKSHTGSYLASIANEMGYL